jgi:hypothetical protein
VQCGSGIGIGAGLSRGSRSSDLALEELMTILTLITIQNGYPGELIPLGFLQKYYITLGFLVLPI